MDEERRVQFTEIEKMGRETTAPRKKV